MLPIPIQPWHPKPYYYCHIKNTNVNKQQYTKKDFQKTVKFKTYVRGCEKVNFVFQSNFGDFDVENVL